jgi:S1-C subfamily serine protease
MRDGTPPLRITADDLARAVVPVGPAAPPPPRTSHLAVASLVLGLLAIPLVGIVLGPLAIGAGVMAVSAIQRSARLTGLRLAVAGMALGSLAMAAWTIGLFLALSRPEPAREPRLVDTSLRAAAGIADAPAHVRRALRANVTLRCRGRGGEVSGSGVVVAAAPGALYAITNRHVIECGGEAPALTAATLGGEPQPAAVAWKGPGAVDAAVVRVATAEVVERVELARAPLPSVGDPVFAVGNPLGYEATFTAGVLSAIRMGDPAKSRLRILQVQASVNPGNSGGGLYDARGRLVGLNTWTTAKGEAEGIGFAISTADLGTLLAETASAELREALGLGLAKEGRAP